MRRLVHVVGMSNRVTYAVLHLDAMPVSKVNGLVTAGIQDVPTLSLGETPYLFSSFTFLRYRHSSAFFGGPCIHARAMFSGVSGIGSGISFLTGRPLLGFSCSLAISSLHLYSLLYPTPPNSPIPTGLFDNAQLPSLE